MRGDVGWLAGSDKGERVREDVRPVGARVLSLILAMAPTLVA